MTPQLPTTIVVAFGLTTSIAGMSCNREYRYPNIDHCANQNGNDWCQNRRYLDGSRPYCILGNGVCGPTPGQDGCVEELPSDECYSPCGYSATLLEDAVCLDEEESSSGTMTSMDPSSGTSETSGSTTGPSPCGDDEECTSTEAPFCDPVGGVCVGCNGLADGDSACAGVDGTRPVCDEDAGVCVQCTAESVGACGGDTPVCDEENSVCVPCVAHEQCGAAACNLFTGACLPESAVVHVGGPDSKMPEFETLVEAVDNLGGDGTVIVHQGDYNEAVIIDGGRTLAFVAANDELPFWNTPGGAMTSQLTIEDSTVLIEGLQLSGNAASDSPGVLVDGGRAWVDRGRIVQNGGGGIIAQNSAELVLRNCFVGGDENDVAAVEVNDSTANVIYTTIGGGFGNATALTCDESATVVLRNSIVVARAGSAEILCGGVDVEYSATELGLGGTNTDLGSMPDTSWFVDYTGGDFHLSGTHPVEINTAAQREAGDPLTDIDGDPRPGAQSADYAGADAVP